jgi:YHS domain-containing protein
MTDTCEPQRLNPPVSSNPLPARTACGGTLKEPDRYPSAEYRGQLVYFCTRACLRAFESDPDRFMAGEIKHPTEQD